MVASETCNSRSLSWLVRSCLPNPHPETRRKPTLTCRISDQIQPENHRTDYPAFSLLPDDLLLECLSRVSPSSLPSVALVCRRWYHFVSSSAFYSLRRARCLLSPTLYAVSVSDFGVLSASHRIMSGETWETSLFADAAPAETLEASLSHARLAVVGPAVYALTRNATIRYDTWTETFLTMSPMLFHRKKFAAAAIAGKIYVSGGCRTAVVEEYDPAKDAWRVVSEAPRKRYGCIGAAVGGVFYVIGGLKIGVRAEGQRRGARLEAHAYASSMDLYDVESSTWLRTRHVPNGGCVVAACAAGGHVYVMASHAVELSFWRCDGRRFGSGFGEWERLKAPPVPAQVRLDGTVRFSCVGVGERVAVVQVVGSIDDLLRRSGRGERGLKGGLVLVYDCGAGEWTRGPDLPEILSRAGCVCVDR